MGKGINYGVNSSVRVSIVYVFDSLFSMHLSCMFWEVLIGFILFRAVTLKGLKTKNNFLAHKITALTSIKTNHCAVDL